MSFKDKLFASKKGKTQAKQTSPTDFGVGLQNELSAELSDIDAKAHAQDSIHRMDEDSLDDVLMVKPSALTKSGINQPPADKKQKQDKTKLKIYLALAILLLLALVALAINQFTKNSTNQSTKAPATQQTASTPKPAPQASTADTQNVAASGSATVVAPSEKLEESISRPMPENKALAAEELDALADERARLEKQEVLLTEQIDTAQKLSELKDQKIALLEQKIKEAEAAAATVNTAGSASAVAQAASGAQPEQTASK